MPSPPYYRHAQIAAVTSALMIAQQVAAKAARDALFLSSFHTSALPLVMAAAAVLSLAGVYWSSRLMARRSPARVITVLFGANGLAFGLEWLLELGSARAAAMSVYLHTALLGPVIVSTFWSLINERFDPYAAKSAVTRIAGGGTLGGVLGGLASWRMSTVVQPVTVLAGLALLNLLALVGTLFIPADSAATGAGNEQGGAQAGQGATALHTLRTMPFLRNLGFLVLLGAASSAILDYVFSAQAVAHFGKGQALLSFFSLFWLAVGVVSFLAQLSLGRLALEKLGLAVNIAVLPGVIILGSALGLAVPGLASASLLRGAEAVQRNTLFRSAYELLYAPLPELQKRVTKALIDIGFDRFGTIVGSGLALLALHAFGAHHATVMLGVVVLLAIATLPLTQQLHRGYVSALKEGLRDGARKLGGTVPPSSSGERSPSSTGTQAREALIERLEAVQPGGLTALLDSESATKPNAAGASAVAQASGEAAAPAPAQQSPSLPLDRASDVLSGDAARVQRGLSGLRPRDPAVPCVIALLGQGKLHDEAREALSKIAPSITGQLIDALLDDEVDFAIRRRVPRVLRLCRTQRAAEGLLLGLADDRFEVRYECGRALLQITDGNRLVEVSREKAIAAIQFEIRAQARILGEVLTDDDPDWDDEDALIDGLKKDRANRGLEHVFAILSLHLEREPLRIAFRALHHRDLKYRGTALEYLSTVLPDEIKDIVWPYLGEAAPLPTARAPQELLADLSRAEPFG